MGNKEDKNKDPSRESYPMIQEKSGYVYIFNHATFDDGRLEVKHSAVKDCTNIEDTFRSLKFTVIVYNDLKYSEILEKLSSINEMDSSNVDCVVIFVLTHGRYGKIFAKDIKYYPDVYWKKLNQSFLTKPKLIFVQADRGDETDDSHRILPIGTNDSFVPTTFPIPDVPDVLLMYSNYDGFFSWRSQVTGSSFIHNLCNELKLKAKNTDMLTLLTHLNQKLESNRPYMVTLFDVQSQVGTVVSTLTRLLYLKPANK